MIVAGGDTMTENIQYKTLVNQWLKAKRSMITPSTHANFILIAENHLIPYFGKRRIGGITEQDIQEYIMYLYNNGYSVIKLGTSGVS